MCPLAADLVHYCDVTTVMCCSSRDRILVRRGSSIYDPPLTSRSPLDPQLQKHSIALCIIGGNVPEGEAGVVTADFSL